MVWALKKGHDRLRQVRFNSQDMTHGGAIEHYISPPLRTVKMVPRVCRGMIRPSADYGK